MVESALAFQLHSIDQEQTDPELRADDFANCLFATALGGGVCYDPHTTLQMLVDVSRCTGAGRPDAAPMLHFSHPPLQGSSSIKLKHGHDGNAVVK